MTDVDVDAALHYPFQGDDALKRFAIGGGVPSLLNAGYLVLLVAMLVVPFAGLAFVPVALAQLVVGLAVTGYFVRVARHTLDGHAEPPAFDDWSGLLGDGLAGVLVALAYQVPVVLLGAVAVGVVLLAAGGMEAFADQGGAAFGFVGVLGVLVAMLVLAVYSLVTAYLLPVSLTAYAAEGRLSAAFSVENVKPVALSGEYAVPWLIAAGVYAGVAGMVSVLTTILVGYLLVPFLPLFYFYLGTMAMAMFGQAYATEHGLAVPSPDEGGEEPRPPSSSRRLEDL